MELSRVLGGGGGAPVGSLLDFPLGLPNLYTKGSQTFLKSGVTTLAASYPDVPNELVSGLLPVISNPVKEIRNYLEESSVNSAGFLIDGTRAVCFFTSQVARTQYMFSADSGFTWMALNLPEQMIVAGAEFFGGNLMLMSTTGRLFTSYDCKNWTYQGTYNYASGSIGWMKIVNGRLYLLPAASWTTDKRSVINGSYSSTSPYLWYTNDGIEFLKTDVVDSRRWNDIVFNGTNYVISHCDTGVALNFKYSTNGTSGWTTSGNAPGGSILVPGVNSGTAYSTNPGPIACLVAEGSTLLAFCSALTHLPGDGNQYYYARCYRSNDDGATWVTRSAANWLNGSNLQYGTTNSVIIDKVNGVYFAHAGGSGGTWRINGDITTTGTFGTAMATATNPNLAFKGSKGFRFGYRSGAWIWGGTIPAASRSAGASMFVVSSGNADPLTTAVAVLARFNSKDNKNLFVRGGSDNTKCLCFSGVTYKKMTSGATGNLSDHVGGHTPYYDYSEDGGETWQIKRMPISAWWTSICWDGTYFYVTCNNATDETDVSLSGGDSTSGSGSNVVYRSSNGLTWTNVATVTGFSNDQQYGMGPHYMVSLPGASNRLVMIGMSINLYVVRYSDDFGVTWSTPEAISMFDQNGSSVSVTYLFDAQVNSSGLTLSGGFVWNTTTQARRILYTKDGLSWRWFAIPNAGVLTSSAVLPNGDIVCCELESGGLTASVDGGTSFFARSSFSASPSTARMTLRVDPVTGWLYAIGGNRLCISKDNGVTWQYSFALNINLSGGNNVSFFDVYDGRVLVGDGNYIYRAPKGEYINNFVSMSTVSGAVKYLRIA